MSNYRITRRLEVRSKTNGFLRDITYRVMRGTATCNDDNLIKRAFSVALRDPRPGDAELRMYQDYLAPFLEVVFDDGRRISSQVGLYQVQPMTKREHTRGYSTTSVEALDLTCILDTDGFEGRYTVLAGQRYTDAIVAILVANEITRYRVPYSSKFLSTATTWTHGTSMLEIANDLAAALGYYELWTDQTGVIVTAPYVALPVAGPARTFRSEDGSEVIGPISDEGDASRIANVIIVEKDDPSDTNPTPIVGYYINDNPSSKVGIPQIGRKRMKVTDSNLADQAAADERARKLGEEASTFGRLLTVKTFPDPQRDLHEVIALDIRNREGKRIADGRWWARSWSMGFTTDEAMTWQLGRDEAWT